MTSPLDAKYTDTEGSVLLTGVQALVRLPLDQHRLDASRGLHTATYVSGYPGSPLGILDSALDRASGILSAHHVVHQRAVNEELAAAAVWGSQLGAAVPYRAYDGVLGMWYGKAPGADRSLDAFRHGNFVGAGANGGVLAVVGDDPAAKSSSLPNDTQPLFYDALMPVLVPGSVQEILDLGLHGFAMSRFSGLWTGFKVVTEVADGVGTARVGRVAPRVPEMPDGWRHVQTPVVSPASTLVDEVEIQHHRLEAVVRYAALNGLNVLSEAPGAWLGIIASGKTYFEVLQALDDLGLAEGDLAKAGVRLLKLGMTWPLETSRVKDFAAGLDEIVVVEEKRPFVETFLRDALYGMPDSPVVLGKRDAHGAALVPSTGALTPALIASALTRILSPRLELREIVPATQSVVIRRRLPLLVADTAQDDKTVPVPKRRPAFCSGCPHNRSTVVPDGAIAGAGVGCHGMVGMEARHAGDTMLPVTPMGGEGVPWIGLAPFVDETHTFQNLGDGTLAHSGILAIRAAVAAGVNVTYKLLYNSAIAMTGGQDPVGSGDVPTLARRLLSEGVREVVVCTDDTRRYGRRSRRRYGYRVRPRSDLGVVQNELSGKSGVTVLIYDQQCAAEARRLRKRGLQTEPRRRVVINEAVCEGCGDCGVKSNCLSVYPVETELGRKTQIDQTSCNKDLTCLDGDCPSFVVVDTVDGAGPAKTVRPRGDVPELPEPERPEAGDGYQIFMTGIGGTGVLTVSQILATAAHLSGLAVTGVDQTGMSQKAGPVTSHLKLFAADAPRVSPTVGDGQADCFLAFDLLVASDKVNLARMNPKRTLLTASSSTTPTAEAVTDIAFLQPSGSELYAAVSPSARRSVSLDAFGAAESLFSDGLAANMLVLGAAYQQGAIPVPAEWIERAIELNGAHVGQNIDAFRWGRWYGAVGEQDAEPGPELGSEPESRLGAVDLDPSFSARQAVRPVVLPPQADDALRRLVWLRAAELVDYQDTVLANRYLDLVESMAKAECIVDGALPVTHSVARQAFKLFAYKDEYEVARLHVKPGVWDGIEAAFPGSSPKILLHPPALRAIGLKRKLEFGRFSLPMLRVLARGKSLRGRVWDPFGRAKVRRIERQIVEEYVAMVQDAAGRIDPANAETILKWLSLPDMVRGYEDIKLANVERFRAEAARLRNSLDELAAGALK